MRAGGPVTFDLRAADRFANLTALPYIWQHNQMDYQGDVDHAERSGTV